ncbi:DNA-directed RNA polymerase III subunit RPC7-like isoform X2 [Salvia splendens]|uniref:DNA-directed RNA polymerase III subunit RPC7-like isoform X2 n=1 Tax=Salvia splendens TaxID=180675 RepID=UPI001C269D1D|nr:DNA-directed RNA polymerase III subunit RPC7-like isoform X2 [Salvia splendens]XP_042011308.1 DNA-directed RNA polymerase III subunit RPC7-like isoform X2 [Salvia splendens]
MLFTTCFVKLNRYSVRGRGGGRGRGGPPRAKQMPFDLFPEVAIGVVKYSVEEVKKYSPFVSWSQNLQTFFETSPYHYQDRRLTLQKMQKLDIERYSDKKLQATTVKQPLHHLIMMDKDHMPAELVRGGRPTVKRIKWGNEIDLNKLDQFEKLEEKHKGTEEENQEEEVEEEENEENEENEEYSDDNDYTKGEYVDDDEDDFNMDDEANEDDAGIF